MPQLFGKANRTQPTSVADGAQVQIRTTGYGEVVTTQLGDNHSALADEGSYFKSVGFTTNPGTPVANAAAPGASYVATTPQFIMYNNGAAGGKRIFMDYIRIYLSASTASTAAAGVGSAVIIEPGVNRRSGTTGTEYVGTNVNTDSGNAPNCKLYWSTGTVLTATTLVSQRVVSRHQFKTQATPAGTAGDVYSMDFGEHMSGAAPLAAGTVAQVYPASVGPVAVGGGASLLFYLWGFTAIPSYEWEIAWWER